MEYIRVLFPGDFDHIKGRFNDLAFKAYDDGISCFEAECATSNSGSVCQHIAKFYSDLTGEPAVFFRFGEAICPPGSSIKPTDVGNNDPCHHDIVGVSRKRAKDLRLRPWSEYSICDGVSSRGLTQEDLDRWKSTYGVPEDPA